MLLNEFQTRIHKPNTIHHRENTINESVRRSRASCMFCAIEYQKRKNLGEKVSWDKKVKHTNMYGNIVTFHYARSILTNSILLNGNPNPGHTHTLLVKT